MLALHCLVSKAHLHTCTGNAVKIAVVFQANATSKCSGNHEPSCGRHAVFGGAAVCAQGFGSQECPPGD